MDGNDWQPESARPETARIPAEVTSVLNNIRIEAQLQGQGIYRALVAQLKLEGVWEFSPDNTLLIRKA